MPRKERAFVYAVVDLELKKEKRLAATRGKGKK